MRVILLTLLLMAAASCRFNTETSSPSQKLEELQENSHSDLYESSEQEKASDDQNYQAALDFINNYIETKNELEILEFVNTSPLASQNLRTALENIVIKAWEEHPKVGLGFDPLLDAQDYPSEGFELHEFNPESGDVLVKGIGWEDFKVRMKIVKEDGHLLVDGCGAVNIPEEKRAPR